MAQGDIKNGLSSVAFNAMLNIQPAAGEEWIIHNIYYDNAVEFYLNNGTNTIKFDLDTSFGARLCMAYHVTNGQYLSIKNTGGAGGAYIGYDGIQTK